MALYKFRIIIIIIVILNSVVAVFVAFFWMVGMR